MLTSKSLLGTTPNQLLFWEDVALAERKRMPPSKQFKHIIGGVKTKKTRVKTTVKTCFY
jgi:hypothetical protein